MKQYPNQSLRPRLASCFDPARSLIHCLGRVMLCCLTLHGSLGIRNRRNVAGDDLSKPHFVSSIYMFPILQYNPVSERGVRGARVGGGRGRGAAHAARVPAALHAGRASGAGGRLEVTHYSYVLHCRRRARASEVSGVCEDCTLWHAFHTVLRKRQQVSMQSLSSIFA